MCVKGVFYSGYNASTTPPKYDPELTTDVEDAILAL
jgi:hypothetical protein